MGPAQHLQDPGGHLGELLWCHHRVDQALGVEVLGHLHLRRERLTVQGLIDPRPQKADQRPRLGRGHMPERPPGGQHPPGGRMPQVDQVGQPGRPVVGDRRRRLDHLQERDRALLEAGPAGGRRRDQRQALPGGPLDRTDQPLAGGDADRAGEEPEFGGDDRHLAVAQPAHPGEDGLVQPRPLPCPGQVGDVAGIDPGRVRHRLVPASPRPGIDHRVDQLGRAETVWRSRPAGPCSCHHFPRLV
jgi:hypothetical protein